jgi:hypothetical protein
MACQQGRHVNRAQQALSVPTAAQKMARVRRRPPPPSHPSGEEEDGGGGQHQRRDDSVRQSHDLGWARRRGGGGAAVRTGDVARHPPNIPCASSNGGMVPPEGAGGSADLDEQEGAKVAGAAEGGGGADHGVVALTLGAWGGGGRAGRSRSLTYPPTPTRCLHSGAGSRHRPANWRVSTAPQAAQLAAGRLRRQRCGATALTEEAKPAENHKQHGALVRPVGSGGGWGGTAQQWGHDARCQPTAERAAVGWGGRASAALLPGSTHHMNRKRLVHRAWMMM